jgi:glycosyltransferase involved in cell wall biosynthesis
MRIAVVANTSWYLYNFRRNLMREIRAAGHDVLAVGSADEYAQRLAQDGWSHVAVPFTGGGVNPLREARTVWALWRLLRRRRIDLVLSYTPKGNIYTGLAARAAGLPFLPNISGLGRVFIRRSALTWLVLSLYRATLRHAPAVFFQNDDDRDAFVRARIVDPSRAVRVPGSGVDLAHFQPPPARPQVAPFRFLMVARLLWDKGVGEYVEAARQIRRERPEVRFGLLGMSAGDNPAAVPATQIAAWQSEGAIDFLGATDDVRPYLASADCVVLPSFREGVPRSLLEAAAMARPVVTTDAPGCRDVVDNGVTGFVCRPRDALDLAAALRRVLALSAEERHRMGLRGRQKMEREFDERQVIRAYLAAIDALR